MIEIATLIERNRSGEAVGLPSFCTANEHVLRAIMEYAAEHNVSAVIEATCNQVNQQGGYTGLTAADFAGWMTTLATEYGVSRDTIILGGDHLGPNPWRHLPAIDAMEEAAILVRDYAAAGFRKIHIDASMACGGEPTPSFELVAERAARLCRIAEAHSPAPENLIYVIGTEVPIPGGETDDMDELAVTTIDRLHETIDTHRVAFEHEGLANVWPRIVSIVTQPGVDFSHTSIHRFKPTDAAGLSAEITKVPGMTFEAHSTDYQPTDALAELVAKHFFFLKVGPELTFRMREAVFALASIENLLLADGSSNLIRIIDKAMDDDPSNWASYYQGDADIVNQLRHFSFSDRIRYYWTAREVKVALERLISNLEHRRLPETIVSQYFPTRNFGDLVASPRKLIADHIKLCVERYYSACGY
jgi:D-tagatose-1,6-bisphosphate aldolase subunit GatZ/KbaZ